MTKALIEDPLASGARIAKKTKTSPATVSRIVKETKADETKDGRILGITDTDLEIVELGTKEIRRRLINEEERQKIGALEIANIVEKSGKRYQIFRGDATDQNGGLKKDHIIIEL